MLHNTIYVLTQWAFLQLGQVGHCTRNHGPGTCFNDGLMVEAQQLLLLLFPDTFEVQKPLRRDGSWGCLPTRGTMVWKKIGSKPINS